MTELDELRRTVEKLASVDERRAGLVEYRDRQILAARAAGATWASMQQLTGLSTRGLQIAIRRAQGLDKSGTPR
jgi:hypothetical protein